MISRLARTVMYSLIAIFLFKNRGRILNFLLSNEKLRDIAVRKTMNIPFVKKNLLS